MSSRKRLVFLALGTLFAMIVPTPIQGQAVEPSERFMVEFIEPLPVDIASAAIQRTGAKMESFIAITDLNKTHVQGYIVHQPEAEGLAKRYHSALAGMSEDLQRETAAEMARASPLNMNDLSESLADYNELAARAEDGNLPVQRAAIVATRRQAGQLRGMPAVANLQIHGREQQGSVGERSESEIGLASTRPSESLSQVPGDGGNCDDNWWPDAGTISTQPSGNATGETRNWRYSYTVSYWLQGSLNNLWACDFDATSFEPDGVYNNYDRRRYLGNEVRGWQSIFPGPYLDWNAFDTTDELTYTVGTWNVARLQPKVAYSTMIYTDRGDADTDLGKLNSQRGWNSCSPLPGNGACIFPRATQRQILAWDHPVPGRTRFDNR